MQFISLGDSSKIAASCHYLSANGVGLVLDAGADPNREGIPSLPRYDLIRSHGDAELRHVIITHAHHDHIGGLPSLVADHVDVDIHLTPATRTLTEFMLSAGARLQRRLFREGSSPHPPLFDEEHVEEIAPLFRTHSYEKSFALKDNGKDNGTPMSAAFYDAGHVLGSAGVLIRYHEAGQTRRLFYTSDTNTRAQTIIPGGCYPAPPLDVLVMECTLGSDAEAAHTTRKDEAYRFGEALRAVLARGGSALIPVFMLGRAQEILAMIDRFKRQLLLPEAVPVYTYGGMRQVSNIYDSMRRDTPRINEQFAVRQVQQRGPFKRGRIRIADHNPSIYVLASGMVFENTLSNRVAQAFVEEEKHAILMVGFCKEDSPGARLLAAKAEGHEGVVLDKRVGMQPLACQVERFRFSGHSNRQDLVELSRHLRPRKTVLVHGDADALAWMAEAVHAAVPDTTVIVPKMGQAITL